MRKIILHYHLFKNAGTSLDATFKENFKGDEWVTKEFPAQPAKNREEVAQWILDNPQAKCFSSHTAFLPPPKLDGIKVLPVIFMRHPIDRIASAYEFERKQGGNSFGAVLARNTDLKGYIETRLSIPSDRQCRNFHMHRFAMMYGEKVGDEFERAKKAVETLPFVGVVENYKESLERLEKWLHKEGFKEISLTLKEKNVSRTLSKPLKEKLKEVSSKLGEEIYSIFVDANKEDIYLYEMVGRDTKL